MTVPLSPVPEENVPDPGLNIFAKLSLSLDGIREQMEKSYRLEQARLAMLPNFVRIPRGVIPGAAVTSLVSFGGPQAGRQWTLRMLMALSTSLATNATIVHWFVGNPLGANQPPPASEAVWAFSSVPGVKEFGGDAIKVLPNQQVLAWCTNIPALTELQFNISVNDQTLYSQSTSVASTE